MTTNEQFEALSDGLHDSYPGEAASCATVVSDATTTARVKAALLANAA